MLMRINKWLPAAGFAVAAGCSAAQPAATPAAAPVEVRECPISPDQGPLFSTQKPLDLAIQGPGYFHVNNNGNDAYTRVGSLRENVDGDLVVAIDGGCELVPPINIPQGATNLTIAQDGTVNCTVQGADTISTAGQIQLTMFTDPAMLHPEGSGLYFTTEIPVVNNPGDNGAGVLIEGYIEKIATSKLSKPDSGEAVTDGPHATGKVTDRANVSLHPEGLTAAGGI